MRIVRGRLHDAIAGAAGVSTSRGVIAGRESILLELEDELGAVGLGEASPLPGFSAERVEDARVALVAWLSECPRELPVERSTSAASSIAEGIRRAVEGELSMLPGAVASARFAVETALLDLAAQRIGVPVWEILTVEGGGRACSGAGHTGSPRRPLAWLLTGEDMAALAEDAAGAERAGYGTLKLKIGALSLEEDTARLAVVRQAAPTARLRLDANGGGRHPLGAVLDLAVRASAELIEEPSALEALWALPGAPPVPVALDESLVPEGGVQRAFALAAAGRVAALVLKPALLGGVIRARDIAERAGALGVGVVVTHALDGLVGHAAAACLALALPPSAWAHGLAPHRGLEHPPLTAEHERVRDRRVRSWEASALGPGSACIRALPYIEGAELVAPDFTDGPRTLPARTSTSRGAGRRWALAARPPSGGAHLSIDSAARGGGRRWALSARRPSGGALLSIDSAARDVPSAVALVDELGTSHTFATLAARVRDAQSILSRTDEADGVYALEGAPRFAEVAVALALFELGRPIVWLHPRAAEAERARILEETGAAVLDAAAILRGATPSLPQRPFLALSGMDAAAVMYTSGSSGRPKGAVLSARALVTAAEAALSRLGVEDDDRFFLGLPLAHVGGLSVLTRGLLARKPVVLGRARRFDAGEMAALFAAERITVASLVPTMLHRLLEEPTFSRGALRTIMLGGAAASPRLLASAKARGLPIRTTYGLTETCAAVTLSAPGAEEDHGAGTALDCVDLRIGAGGTIEVRGPTLFSGYLRGDGLDPARSAEGWFDTGDFGRLDHEGRLFVFARRSDLIVSGGENVYPAEVEAALEAFPAVLRACAFGLEDERWGERVWASVVAEPPLDRAALATHLTRMLAPHKRPLEIIEVEALPELPSGKVDRVRVRSEATAREKSSRAVDSDALLPDTSPGRPPGDGQSGVGAIEG